jgi:uncharacterized protein YjcR
MNEKLTKAQLQGMLVKAEKKEKFKEALRAGMGFEKASQYAGIPPTTLRRWKEKDGWDTEFKQLIAERHMRLVSQLDEHIFVKKDLNALKFELKAKLPHIYREDAQVLIQNNNNNSNGVFDKDAHLRILENLTKLDERESKDAGDTRCE